MSFRCLYVDRFVDAASPERMLIANYRARGQAPWNVDEGFAPKDVGHKRDMGEPGQWFIDRPANYQAPITVEEGGREVPVLRALGLLKEEVPFDLFRYASRRSRGRQDQRDAATDYPGRSVVLPVGPASVLQHVRAVVARLPVGWQATVLPHGVILYKETHDYDYALAGWRRTANGLEALSPGSEAPIRSAAGPGEG